MSYTQGMKAIRVRELTQNEIDELHTLYDRTKEVRMRTRAQMILLSVEQNMTSQQIGQIVRKNDQTVRRWIKRYNAEGINGLQDAPRPGAPGKVTVAYCERLLNIVRQRPRTLEQPYSVWTLERLADFMAEETGIRVTAVTVRRVLKAGGIVLSRPQHTISSPDPEYKVKKRRLKTQETT
jgi:transposase